MFQSCARGMSVVTLKKPRFSRIYHRHPTNHIYENWSRGTYLQILARDYTIKVPGMGDSITEGTVVQWMKQEGDSVRVDDVVAVIETDKVSNDVHSSKAGVLSKQHAKEGDVVQVGAPLASIDTSDDGETDKKPVPAPTPPPPIPSQSLASQSPQSTAESMKKSSKVDMQPTTDMPLRSVVDKEVTVVSPLRPGQKVELPKIEPIPSSDRTETRIKMSRMRLRIAERLKSAQNTAAMLTTFQETDMSKLMSLRNEFKDDFEKKHGVKLGFMSAFIRASADALREVPAVNGYIDDASKEIVHRNYVDISVAVASPKGLVVPVLRNVEDMSFADIEKGIAYFAAKAKEDKLALEDMAGGSFTVSNGGVFGSLMGTPIINPPQSAILGMHATKMRAVVVDGEVVARPMMYLALTYDHRLIDGREAVTFLKSIAKKIEDPTRLLLDI